MRQDGDRLIFSDAGETYANDGVVGIDGNGVAFEGYDGALYLSIALDESLNSFTPAQKRELAEFMIERWKQFGCVE